MPQRRAKTPLVYFDVCCWSRLFDDRTQERVRKKAEAMDDLMLLYSRGKIRVVVTTAIDEEVKNHPIDWGRSYIFELLDTASVKLKPDDSVQTRADYWLQQCGLKAFDALHVSFSEVGEVDYLCTCDDRFLKKARKLVHPPPTVLGPHALLTEIAS
jgi:hypothetical protein